MNWSALFIVIIGFLSIMLGWNGTYKKVFALFPATGSSTGPAQPISGPQGSGAGASFGG